MTEASTVRVSTRTIDDALAIGSQVYHRHVLHVADRGAEFGMKLRASTLGPIVIGTLEYRTPVRIEAAEFIDSYQVNVPLYGGVVMSYAGREQRATTRQAVVHGPAAPTVIDGWRVPTRLLGVKIIRAGLENTLAGLLGRPIERPIEFHGTVDITTRSGREWVALARRLDWWALRNNDGDGNGNDGDRLVGPTLVEAVIGGLLRIAPHDYSAELDDALASRTAETTGRAIAVMHSRAHSNVSVSDIAAEVGVGVRALEKRFRAECGCTPSEMLSDIRLAYARRSLQDTRTGGVRIGEVAARWGLPHAGRFSARYAEKYGESPSVTLSRARNAPPPD